MMLSRAVVIPLLVGTLLIAGRYASRQYEVIDWDEDTFMLMAQEVMRGHLPYVYAFDNKPPGMFFALAGAMAVFGQTLQTVRWFGDCCAVLTALLTFGIARRYVTDAMAGFIVGGMAAAMVGGYAFSASTELLADVALMAALWLLLAKGEQHWSAWAVGLLLSFATLTRLSLIYADVAFGIVYLTRAIGIGGFVGGPRDLVAFVFSGLLPVAALTAVYAYCGALGALTLAMLTVPASYAFGQEGIGNVFGHMFWALETIFADGAVWLALFLLALLFSLPPMVYASWCGRLSQDGRRDILIICIVSVGVLLSVCASGTFYTHYLLQALPFVAILIAFGAGSGGRGAAWSSITLSCLGVAIMLVRVVPLSLGTLANEPGIEAAYPIKRAAAAIAADEHPGDRVWAMDDHLALFYLQQPPISPIFTHPDNVARSQIATPLIKAGYISDDEFGRVLALRPRYIVSKTSSAPNYLTVADEHRLDSVLAKAYSLWFSAQDITVFRLKPQAAAPAIGTLPASRDGDPTLKTRWRGWLDM